MRNVATRFARLAPALALAVIAMPAEAQVVSAAYRSSSKSEAILGGAPSALAAITANQDGRSMVAPAAARSYFRPAVANRMQPAVSSSRRFTTRRTTSGDPNGKTRRIRTNATGPATFRRTSCHYRTPEW